MQCQLKLFRKICLNITITVFTTLVRLNVDCRIEPHAPPFIQTPANLFKFYLCSFTPQAKHFRVSLYKKKNFYKNVHKFRARTTRVSNPDWYSCFSDSTSDMNEKPPRRSKILTISWNFISRLYLSPVSSHLQYQGIKKLQRYTLDFL